MHIYFSGIGGAGIGPLAMVAYQAGYSVSGSDKQDSKYIHYLKSHGITNIHVGQTSAAIASEHQREPIDWFVYTSALPLENPDAPELLFCHEQGIPTSKRDQLLTKILSDQQLSLIAVAGTHGKTTTTAMVAWLFHCLNEPMSYIIPAETSFAEMGGFNPQSRHFIYEADEFDRNFLAFYPELSLITGVSWDHHEIFKTREAYKQAFREFISQSKTIFAWQEDVDYLALNPSADTHSLHILNERQLQAAGLNLMGAYNRRDAFLAVSALAELLQIDINKLITYVNQFPGLQRRMEQLIPGLYSDYAHTPEKIRGGISAALELAEQQHKKLIVIYEPLTNRRQHYMKDNYQDVFAGAKKVYWIPSYLAREDPDLPILSPAALISHLTGPTPVVAAERDNQLLEQIKQHLRDGDMVVAMAGGGGGSLDEWLRERFLPKH